MCRTHTTDIDGGLIVFVCCGAKVLTANPRYALLALREKRSQADVNDMANERRSDCVRSHVSIEIRIHFSERSHYGDNRHRKRNCAVTIITHCMSARLRFALLSNRTENGVKVCDSGRMSSHTHHDFDVVARKHRNNTKLLMAIRDRMEWLQ